MITSLNEWRKNRLNEKVQSVPTGTKVTFRSNGMDGDDFGQDHLTPEQIEQHFDKDAIIDGLASFTTLGDKDYEYYDITFDDGTEMYGVSGYHLDPLTTNENGSVSEHKMNESTEWYQKNGYVSDESITSKEELIKKIEEKIQPALTKYCKEHDLPELKYIGIARNMLSIKSNDIPMSDLGIFQKVLKNAYLFTFNRFKIETGESNGKFMFKNPMWAVIDIGYESLSGGSNAMSLDRSISDVHYDILSGEIKPIEKY